MAEFPAMEIKNLEISANSPKSLQTVSSNWENVFFTGSLSPCCMWEMMLWWGVHLGMAYKRIRSWKWKMVQVGMMRGGRVLKSQNRCKRVWWWSIISFSFWSMSSQEFNVCGTFVGNTSFCLVAESYLERYLSNSCTVSMSKTQQEVERRVWALSHIQDDHIKRGCLK